MLTAVSMTMLFFAACTSEPNQDTKKIQVTTPPPTGRQAQTGKGEMLFRQFCANCHPDGGNVSDPARNLHRSTLRANRINKPEDIIRIMRNPISRMLRFDVTTLPDEDARAIADYVLDTF
jgi:cytochrome c6